MSDVHGRGDGSPIDRLGDERLGAPASGIHHESITGHLHLHLARLWCVYIGNIIRSTWYISIHLSPFFLFLFSSIDSVSPADTLRGAFHQKILSSSSFQK